MSVVSVLSMLVRERVVGCCLGNKKKAFNSVGNNSYNHVYLRLE